MVLLIGELLTEGVIKINFVYYYKGPALTVRVQSRL